ncbi:hypothetical protein AAMO2058_001461900 [Amorphochlora amoebiformis]
MACLAVGTIMLIATAAEPPNNERRSFLSRVPSDIYIRPNAGASHRSRMGGARNPEKNGTIDSIILRTDSMGPVGGLPGPSSGTKRTPVCSSREGSRVWLTPGHGTWGGFYAFLVWLLSASWGLQLTHMFRNGHLSTVQFSTLIALIGLSLASHLKTMLTNPGSIPSNAVFASVKPGSGVTFCRKCHAFKPKLAHHCRICGRCISRMDHHCPWVNNCVGAANQKHFVLFLIYMFAASISNLALAIRGLLMKSQKLAGTLLRTLIGVVSVFSSGFVGTMIFLQAFVGILTGRGTVDRIFPAKGLKYRRVPFKDVFGTDIFRWFLPVAPKFKDERIVFGYSLPNEASCYGAKQVISDAAQIGVACILLSKTLELVSETSPRQNPGIRGHSRGALNDQRMRRRSWAYSKLLEIFLPFFSRRQGAIGLDNRDGSY